MNDKNLQKHIDDFSKACEEDGFIPKPTITYKQEVVSGLNDREKILVDYIVTTYLNIVIKPEPCEKKTSSKEPKNTSKKK